MYRTIIKDSTFIILGQKYQTGLLLWSVLLLFFEVSCLRYFYLERVFYSRPESTLSFFYKQLLYKQLGSDFLRAKQFSASNQIIFSNFACFETFYYID